MPDERPDIDWPAVHARLERARRALEAGGGRGAEDVRRLLRERAERLARPTEPAPDSAAMLDLVVFSLGDQRYGVDALSVVDAARLGDLTAVPCTTAAVLGVVNHRGRVLAVLDLRRLAGSAGPEVEAGFVVVVEAEGVRLGVLADAVCGTQRVPAAALLPPPASLTRDQGLPLVGVTVSMVAVLDLAALAEDPRVVVDEAP